MHLALRVAHAGGTRGTHAQASKILKQGSALQPYNWIFGYRSVIVHVIVRGHSHETEKACAARAEVLSENLSLLRMAGLTTGQPGMETRHGGFAENSLGSPHRAERYAKFTSGRHWMQMIFVIGLCAGSANSYQQRCLQ